MLLTSSPRRSSGESERRAGERLALAPAIRAAVDLALQRRGPRPSRVQDRRETPIDHALAVEGLIVRVVLHPFVRHHLFPAGDARFPARPFDPAEYGRLAVLEVYRALEIGDLAVMDIVTPAFEHARCAMI